MRGVRLEFEILAATLGIKPKSYRNGLEQCGFSRTISPTMNVTAG
jgi:hypothetical protein